MNISFFHLKREFCIASSINKAINVRIAAAKPARRNFLFHFFYSIAFSSWILIKILVNMPTPIACLYKRLCFFIHKCSYFAGPKVTQNFTKLNFTVPSPLFSVILKLFYHFFPLSLSLYQHNDHPSIGSVFAQTQPMGPTTPHSESLNSYAIFS